MKQISRHLDGRLIKLSVTKKNCIFMCERDCENKKLVITKFSLFLETPNSNFVLVRTGPYSIFFSFKFYSFYLDVLRDGNPVAGLQIFE